LDEYETKKTTFAGADREEASRCGCDAQFGPGVPAVLQALEVSESTLEHWRKQYGGMKNEEAVRLKKLKRRTSD